MHLFSSSSGRASILALGLLMTLSPPVSGQEEVGRFQLALGYLDVSAQQGREGALDAEHRWGEPLVWRLRPQVGGTAFSDGSIYLHAGLHLPIRLGRRFVATPTVAAGPYLHGSQVVLGSMLEFRSGLSLGVRLGRGRRLFLFFHHLSNGGLGDRNPGVEVAGIGYSVAAHVPP